MLVLTLIILTATVSYFLLKLNYRYWRKRGVPGPEPTLFVGNLGKTYIGKASVGEAYSKIYNQYQDEEFVGLFRITSPILLVRSPEALKEVLVRSFNHFHDNDIELNKKHDPIMGRNPFMLKGEEWRIIRAQLTPGFTSGKMKWIFPHLEENCLNLVKFIHSRPETTNGEGYEAKELSMKFTLNNVASCAFGLEGSCFVDENCSFRRLATDFFATDSWGFFSFFVMAAYPPITKLIPMRFVTKDVEKRLINMVSKALKYREDNNIVRNDFLHVMSQLKKTCKDYEFTDVDVTAHAAGFFGDGYETSSIVMSFALFELAANPSAQNRVRVEVRTAFGSNKTISYDTLQTLQLLDAAINESLRLHPPMYFLQKQCTKDFSYKSLKIDKGTPIVIPVYGLHTDSKYYEDPWSYKPERFLEENKDNLTKYTFLPFGEGPRACLGRRFGLLQVKAGIAYIIQHYELSVNKKTQLPLKIETRSVMTVPVGGLWIDFKKIN